MPCNKAPQKNLDITKLNFSVKYEPTASSITKVTHHSNKLTRVGRYENNIDIDCTLTVTYCKEISLP